MSEPVSTPPVVTTPSAVTTPPAGTPPAGTPPVTPPVGNTTPTTPPTETPKTETPKIDTTALGAPDAPVPKLDAEGKPIEEVAPQKAPENYEPFKLADGQAIDETALQMFIPIAKELNLTQGQAQKLVSIQSELKADEIKQWTKTVDGWLATAKSDKEYGGTAWDENIGVAKKAVTEFGTPAFKTALNEYGMGNHPEFIRFCLNVGKALGESTTRTANANAGEKRSHAEVLYDNTN